MLAGYAGRLLPHKGIHVLMEAARRAMSRSASLHLVILGGNSEMLREGEDGLLVPPGDPERLSEALVALATNSELRRGLAAGALSARSRFDSLEVARRAAAVLRMAAPGVVPATNVLQPLRVET